MQPEQITEVDELTGLFRRGAFDRNLADCITESSTAEEPITLIMADLDKFKSINDTHGHPCGDEVLQVIATLSNKPSERREDVTGTAVKRSVFS